MLERPVPFWAKSSESGGHPLEQHLLDVAAVACEVIQRTPHLLWRHWVSLTGCAPDDARDWLAAVCGLHDLGKATPGFQAKWAPGADVCFAAGFRFPMGSPDRHDASSAALLRTHLIRRGVDPQTASLLADAASAHHGFVIHPTELAHAARYPLDQRWTESHRALVDLVIETVVASETKPCIDLDAARRAALMHWLAGLCAVSDWIGSNAAFFPHRRPWAGPHAHFSASRALACAALDAVGFKAGSTVDQIAKLNSLTLALSPGHTARPLQLTVESATKLLTWEEPALLIVEAPMGEGKTEAALAIDAALRQRGQSRGLYLALPTQATSNAMFSRVAEYLSRLGGHVAIELQLAHGGAGPAAASLRLAEIGFGEADRTVQASSWFSTGKRALLAANAVGTVDQALVGVLHAKHHFVRLFGLAGRVVVLDEVHAYDAYTGGLIESLVAWLLALRCTVVMMSATLPRDRLNSLVAAFGGPRDSPTAPYPRVTLVQGGLAKAWTYPAFRSGQVSLKRLPSTPHAIAEQAAALADHGACVLVVCNTVARAQAVYQHLASRRGVRLFHARFPLDERLDIERDVVSTLGGSGSRRSGAIVVATQVAEQSLDIDADALITDLAPIDLLLQRIGRLHRHKRDRPALATRPTAWIVGLGDDGMPDSALLGRVYHRHMMLRTAAMLHNRRDIDLPSDIDALVQRVYSSEAIGSAERPEHREALVSAAADWQRDLDRCAMLAAQAAIGLPEDGAGFQQAAPMDDEAAGSGLARFGTRLGSVSLTVVPVFRRDGRYCVHPEGPTWACNDTVPAWAADQLAGRWLRLSEPRVVKGLLNEPLPQGWNTHSGLCHYRPLILSAERTADVAAVHLHLDQQLGLVYLYAGAPDGTS